jgi:hypothetical protein
VAALAAILVLGAAGCSEAPDAAPPAEEASGASPLETSPLEVSAVRVRGWAGAPLNEDTGWAAPPGQAAVVFADRPFRIRFEVEAPAGSGGALPTHFSLQARRNEGRWETLGLRDFPYPDEISTPRVSLTRVEVWAGGLASEDLLDGSSFPFAPGQGVSDPVSYDVEGDALPSDSVTAPWPETTAAEDGAVSPSPPVHGEWEWPLVIRRWADGAVTNEAGDTFDFRMVDDRGRPLGGTGPVRVTLRIPEGLLGGTYVETPGVLGPWQDDEGTLYFPMEPAETFNVLMMMASDDHGASWEERDGANRPLTDDLEGFATARAGDTIYLLHQISEATFLHGFDTARERWVIRDEPVSTHGEPPTQVAALVDRSDGSLVALYGDSLGLLHRTRAPGGGWGPEGRVPVEGGGVASGIMATRAADDVVHLAYTVTAPDGGERRVEHRALSPDGTLTRATVLGGGIGTSDDEIGALLPLGWVEGPNTVVVAWRGADGLLRERRIRADGSVSGEIRISPRTVVQSGADSEQVGADLVVHDGAVHVVFIDARTGALWHAVSPAPGSWRAVGEVVGGIDAQWVRGRAVEGADGEPVYGIVYDAGSDGGSGKNRYHAIPLDRGG